MEQFWTFANGKPEGPYSPEELVRLPDFKDSILVCRMGEPTWQAASEYTSIRQALAILKPSETVALANRMSPSIAAAVMGQIAVVESGDFSWRGSVKRSGQPHELKRTSLPLKNFKTHPGIHWSAPERRRGRLFMALFAAVALGFSTARIIHQMRQFSIPSFVKKQTPAAKTPATPRRSTRPSPKSR